MKCFDPCKTSVIQGDKNFGTKLLCISLIGHHHHHHHPISICVSYASLGELIFEPGDKEAIIAVNILDDTVPEEEESFRVQLKNPKGGAEIGINSYVRVTVLSNDDAYGVIAFAQVHLKVKVVRLTT